MKKIFTLFAFLLLVGIAHAQAPQGIPYQAAARNSSGAVLASTSVSVRFTIRDSITTGVIKYRETHSTTTDANGMFSVNVGQGTPLSGTFASINWGTNAKFMQVELDPAGGSSYVDMGTQQMMSVPYSIYSSHAGNGFSSGNTGDIMYYNGTNWVKLPAGTDRQVLVMNGGLPAWGCILPHVDSIYGSATLIAGGSMPFSVATTGGTWSSSNTILATVSNIGIVTANPYIGSVTISYTVTNACGSSVATKQVNVIHPGSLGPGVSYGGGKVAYIYGSGDPGYIAGETHGLIAAPTDQSSAMKWGCSETYTGSTTYADLNKGAVNTAIISNACGYISAARLCADLVLGGFNDWYLPSRDELYKLYIYRSTIGGFSTSPYWSSTEYSVAGAYFVDFSSGFTNSNFKNATYRVRAVRSF